MKAAALLPKMLILRHTPITSSDAHALAKVLRSAKKEVTVLQLYNCSLRNAALMHICSAMQDMDGGLLVRQLVHIIYIRDGNRLGRRVPVGSRFFNRPVKQVEKQVKFLGISGALKFPVSRKIYVGIPGHFFLH